MIVFGRVLRLLAFEGWRSSVPSPAGQPGFEDQDSPVRPLLQLVEGCRSDSPTSPDHRSAIVTLNGRCLPIHKLSRVDRIVIYREKSSPVNETRWSVMPQGRDPVGAIPRSGAGLCRPTPIGSQAPEAGNRYPGRISTSATSGRFWRDCQGCSHRPALRMLISVIGAQTAGMLLPLRVVLPFGTQHDKMIFPLEMHR